jgi:hypothetical protein
LEYSDRPFQVLGALFPFPAVFIKPTLLENINVGQKIVQHHFPYSNAQATEILDSFPTRRTLDLGSPLLLAVTSSILSKLKKLETFYFNPLSSLPHSHKAGKPPFLEKPITRSRQKRKNLCQHISESSVGCKIQKKYAIIFSTIYRTPGAHSPDKREYALLHQNVHATADSESDKTHDVTTRGSEVQK